jgi:hypothetical protein
MSLSPLLVAVISIPTLTTAIPPAATSAQSTPPERARVMIVGVYHFDAPNLDLVKSEKVDHLSEKKQAEIAEVLQRLAAFEPTKIVLEAPPDATKVQERYQAYLQGKHTLAGDEREQLGFQLAKRFSHPRVILADHPSSMDFGAIMAAAQKGEDKRFLGWFEETMGKAQGLMDRQAKLSVRDALVMLNEPALQRETLDMYLQLARVRDEDDFVGAKVVAEWYRRNFCIFANIAAAVDSPQDRVIVLFGQGHAPYLRELVQSSPDLELVEANEYLGR